ncbi:MAG: flagellar hook-length control protein FliK [Candidatus Scalinduaceae bacterium]
MSEHALNLLFGNVTAKESSFAVSSKKTENSSQANVGEESFLTKLAHSVESISTSNKQILPSITLGSTMLNLNELNDKIEMTQKDILPNIEGLEQLLRGLNHNINNSINHVPDSDMTSMTTQLHTLLNDEAISLTKDVNSNINPMLKQNSVQEKTESNNPPHVPNIYKLLDTITSINNIINNVKSGVSTNKANTLLNNFFLNNESAGTVKDLNINLNTNAKATNTAGLVTIVEKTDQNASFQSSRVILNTQTPETDVLLDTKEGHNNRTHVQPSSHYTNSTSPVKLNTNPSLRQSSVQAKAEGQGLNVVRTLNAMITGKGVVINDAKTHKLVNKTSISQYTNNTSPVNLNTNPSLRQGSVQAKAKGQEPLNELNVSKLQDNIISGNSNRINNVNLPAKMALSGGGSESAIQANTSLDNSFISNQSTGKVKDSNVNLTDTNITNTTSKPNLDTIFEKTNQNTSFQSSRGVLNTQDFSKTSSANSNTSPLLQQTLVQAKVENNVPPQELNVSKSQDTKTSVNNSTSNIKLDESATQTNTSPGNSFVNPETSDSSKELNINFANIKQGIESKVNYASDFRHINISQPLEKLGENIADNIIQRAKLFMQGDKSEIRIQLNPPELGNLKLDFKIIDDHLEAKIVVERSIVRDIIEKDIPKLRELISNSDIDVGKLDVSLQGKEEEKLSFTNKGFQSDPGSHESQDLMNQEKENLEDEVDEELAMSLSNSNEINYLV